MPIPLYKDPSTYAQRIRWSARVLDWATKRGFYGKLLDVPREVELFTWAATADEARVRLNTKAEDLGYGLGGIFALMPAPKACKSRRVAVQPAKKEKETNTMSREEENQLLAMFAE